MTARTPGKTPYLVLLTLITSLVWGNPQIFKGFASGQDKVLTQEELNKKKAELNQELSQKKSAIGLAHDELEEIDRDLSYISEKLERTTAELKTKLKQVDALNREHARAIADLSKAQKRFEARLVEWYKSGAESVLTSLLSTGNLSNFILAMAYSESILKTDRETIEFIKEQQAQIFLRKERLDKEIANKEKLVEEMRAQEKEYKNLHNRHSYKMEELERDVKKMEEALRELEASSYEVKLLLQSRRFEGVAGSPKGLISPLSGPIISDFGMRKHPILRRVKMHTGIDITAPAGTPIHAAGAGKVVYSGWKKGYGYCIIIDHGGGLATLYAHCSRLLVGEGEVVPRGYVIAKVGTTGLSTGNHLHFEVRINGDPVDPKPYI